MRDGASYIAKLIRSEQNFMKKIDLQTLQYTKALIICMNGQCNNVFLRISLDGQMLKGLRFDSNELIHNSPKGCTLKADLKHPKKLHNRHNDYLLALEATEIKKDMLHK